MARSICFSPRALEIAELPPIPNRFPSAINIINTGVARETAATCRGSPVCPIKKVSAML